MKLFFSWQSDVSRNRSFIQKAIREAFKVVEGFELDVATRDKTGSPDIASTIIEKIDDSNMLIADVSVVNAQSNDSRIMPNPNVMFELGYAFKSLGESNIILFADTATTDTAKLPFDIRNRRMILENIDNPKSLKSTTDAIITALRSHTQPETTDSSDAPQVFLTNDTAVWASNYGGHGASFQIQFSIDNYQGRNDFITSVKIKGTNGDGTPFETDYYTIDRETPNHPFPVPADDIKNLVTYVSTDRKNYRPMPDLDRDTVKFEVKFRSGKTVSLPIHIREN